MSREKDIVVWSVALSKNNSPARFKKHVEDVFDIVGPSFSACEPLNLTLTHLASDAAFPLIYSDSFLPGSVRKVSRTVNVTIEDKTSPLSSKHSMKCLLSLYAQLVSENQSENHDSNAITQSTNELASHLGALERAFPSSLDTCPGSCFISEVKITQFQLDGLMYMFNLVSDYILAGSVGSTSGSHYIQRELTMAWTVV